MTTTQVRSKRELPFTAPGELRAALRRLDARERRILELRYGLGEPRPQTLKQVGRRFGISGERVRQIERQALHRLKGRDTTPTAEPADPVNRASQSRPCLAPHSRP